MLVTPAPPSPRRKRQRLPWCRLALCSGAILLVAVCATGARAARSRGDGASRHVAGAENGAAAHGRAQDAVHLPQPPHTVHRPGYLGVSLRDLDAAEATRLQRRGAMGAMIVTVDRDAPAWTAGLRPQDVVLEMNGQAIDGVELLRRRLRECPSGDMITLRVRRGNEEMSFSVMLGDQDTIAQDALSRHLRPAPGIPAEAVPANSFTSPAPAVVAGTTRGVASTLFDALIPGSTYTGLEVATLTPQLASFFGAHVDAGLLVTAVNAESPAAAAGLTAGDVILRAGNQPVGTRSALAHALRSAKGNAVPLAVLRDRKETILSLLPEKRKKL